MPRGIATAAAVSGLFILSAGQAGAQPEPAAAQPASQPSTPPRAQMDPEADRIFRESSEHLAGARNLSVHVEVWNDEVLGIHKVQTARVMDVKMHRPDGLYVKSVSPRLPRDIWFNGKTVTFLDTAKNFYSVVDSPPDIDQMLEAMHERVGVVIPLDDLLLSDPYTSFMSMVTGGVSFGKTTILGTPCKHIAFGTPAVDVQFWIEDRDQPLPRKLVITYKNEFLAPQFTAIFSDWDLRTEIPAKTFAFTPPQGATKIEVLPPVTDRPAGAEKDDNAGRGDQPKPEQDRSKP